jgi:hypothetical protein
MEDCIYNTDHHIIILFMIRLLSAFTNDIHNILCHIYISLFKDSKIPFFIQYKNMVQIVTYITDENQQYDDTQSFPHALDKLLSQAKLNTLIL